MSVTRDLATVLTECKTSEMFHEFLVKICLLTQQDVGLLVSSEASSETMTLPLLKADNVTTKGIADVVSQERMVGLSRSGRPSQISEAWVKTHGFTVPSNMLVNENALASCS